MKIIQKIYTYIILSILFGMTALADIMVIAPNGGETLNLFETIRLKWATDTPLTEVHVIIEYYAFGGAEPEADIVGVFDYVEADKSDYYEIDWFPTAEGFYALLVTGNNGGIYEQDRSDGILLALGSPAIVEKQLLNPRGRIGIRQGWFRTLLAVEFDNRFTDTDAFLYSIPLVISGSAPQTLRIWPECNGVQAGPAVTLRHLTAGPKNFSLRLYPLWLPEGSSARVNIRAKLVSGSGYFRLVLRDGALLLDPLGSKIPVSIVGVRRGPLFIVW